MRRPASGGGNCTEAGAFDSLLLALAGTVLGCVSWSVDWFVHSFVMLVVISRKVQLNMK